ncbi:DNA damage-regulated autophagy modulator protein 1 isoform X2 [Hydra vulgaris]|uniref:DNA damage-regulated autophagy modulator protein 1 isoform X2 n=2 Tax=Hydra vulgaris TaxID=6087 RepID=UPI001F5F85D3|nr:DNA damage-regulated autophagy modulator protein 1 isoform X1 [Hydra vulgaris]
MDEKLDDNKLMERTPHKEIKHCNCSCVSKYGLGIFPILFGVCVMLTFIISYTIAVIDRHIDPFFPRISDTGSKKPESNVFGLLLSICSFLGFSVAVIRFIQLNHKLKTNELIASRVLLINKIGLFFGVVACFGVVVVANFQDQGESSEFHDVGAVFVFGGGVVYCCFQTYLTACTLQCGFNSKCLYYVRLILCISSAILFILFGVSFYFSSNATSKALKHLLTIWKSTDPGYKMHITSSLSEWFCAVCLLIYFISFSKEFYEVKIGFTIKRNELGYQSIPQFV